MEKLSAINASQNKNAYISETDEKSNEITVLQDLISNRYHIIKLLGKGSQGAVFLAETNDTHEKVAIKQLIIQSVKDWKQYDLFKREADVLQRIDIPGVAKLHETIELLYIETPMALIVQDYIEGEPLQKFITNGHRFQISQIGDILLQLLDILDKLHHSDPPVIHRDIKPSNIILNYTENSSTLDVYLIDFGAVANPQVKGGGSTVVGTYGYMSPEQLMGCATAASDLYSLAIVAVYLLSGVPPEELEIQDFHVLIDPHLQHLPHQITAFLRKMLEPHEADRMTDYAQLRTFFDAIKNQQFDKIPHVSFTLDKENYSLENVHSYHQQGNIILWQELPDKTPRKISSQLNKLLNQQFKEQSEEDEDCINFQHKSKSITLFIIIIWVQVLTVLIFKNMTRSQYVPIDSQMENSFHLNFVLMVIILVLSLVGLTIFKRIKNRKYILSKYKYDPCIFLENARKSMATVTRIKYKSIYFELKNSENLQMGTYYTPTWIITYSFNPPDDSSPDVLIRSFETHIEPDFNEGDLIPILYLIELKNNKESVYSAPFPIPSADSFAPTDETL